MDVTDPHFLVCRICGHVQPIATEEQPSRCENCRNGACLSAFVDEDEALDFSDEIVERNEQYDWERQGGMGARA